MRVLRVAQGRNRGKRESMYIGIGTLIIILIILAILL
jgi:hypothetical protein